MQEEVQKSGIVYRDGKEYKAFYPSKTPGQIRIRTSFNPSNDSKIDQIKNKFAELIDLISGSNVRIVGEYVDIEKEKFNSSEQSRLFSLALTKIEEAAMWTVKAITHTDID